MSAAFPESSLQAVASDSHVLDARDFPLWGSRLIEASAGTGKTWTIAALYLRLVLGARPGEPARSALQPAQILVMTFTRAATRELSDRIRARLLEAVQCFRGEAEPASHDHFLHDLRAAYAEGAERTKAAWMLEMAAQSMDDAAIHTIDAWCQRMLREHAFDSGNLFDETLEPDESQRQQEAAQDYWRQQCYPLAPEHLEWVEAVWSHYDDFEADVLNLLKVDWEPSASDEQPLLAVLQPVIDTVTPLAQAWQDKALRYQDWLQQQVQEFESHWNQNKASLSQVQKWSQALVDWTRAPGSHQGFWMETEDKHAVQRLRPDGLLSCRKRGAPGLELPAFVVDFESLFEQMRSLPPLEFSLRRHAAVHVQRRLQWIKQQSGTFGFADMLDRLNAALSGPHGPALRDSIRKQYPVALIDEFQDTSPQQYRLFDHVYQTARNDPESALLLIGDPKQSIYGFRGADIYSYLHARRATQGRHYVLGTNYRSTQPLVDAVNHWFAQAEQRTDAGQGAFLFRSGGDNPLPFVPVAAQGRREVLQCEGQPVPALTLAWAHGTNDKGEAVPWNAHTIHTYFSAQCANQIVQWLMTPTQFVQSDGTAARVKPADIAVLVRNGKEAQAVREALAQRGVASVYLSDRESVFGSQEAQDLLWWLRAVAEPRNATLVRAALATPLLGLSFPELATLVSDEDAFDARSEQMLELHGIWQRQGVLAMLRQTLYRVGLPEQWLARMDGERRLTNYLHLAELLQTASAQLKGEQALVRWLMDKLAAPSGADDAQIVRLESDADLVKVVTIHKSKGLEYPIVCVPFAGAYREVDGKAAYVSLPIETQAGPARKVVLDFDAAQTAEADKERLREELRLLYVALTRPRHALWMGLAPLKTRGSKPSNEKGAVGYLLSGGKAHTVEGWRERVAWLAQQCPAMHLVDVGEQPLPDMQYQALQAAPQLQAPQAYSASFDKRWGIGSFSSLTSTRTAAQLPVLPVPSHQPAGDEMAPTADLPSAGTLGDLTAARWVVQPRAAADAPVWHRFMRGAVVGNFVHDQLEWLTGEGFELPAQPVEPATPLEQRLLRRCERAGRGAQSADLLVWLRAIVHHPLPPLQRSLHALAQEGCLLAEMEFWLPAHQLSAPHIDGLCRQYIQPQQERPALANQSLHGMLMGFADLVVEHEGRYWVLDYKTNHLGNGPEAYGAEALADAMLHHRYDVQAALYLLALHRLLKSRLGDAYDPAQQLGGALYFFVRGMDGAARGMHHVPANLNLLDALDAMLAQHTTTHGESR